MFPRVPVITQGPRFPKQFFKTRIINMKKFLLGLLIATTTLFTATVPTQQSVAQSTKKVVCADTSTNADTTIVTFNPIGSNVVGIQATVKRLTGTATGIVLLQGTIDNLTWVDVNTDTLTVSTSSSSVNASRVWPITRTTYTGYRCWFKNTSSSTTSLLTGTVLRRPDEN